HDTPSLHDALPISLSVPYAFHFTYNLVRQQPRCEGCLFCCSVRKFNQGRLVERERQDGAGCLHAKQTLLLLIDLSSADLDFRNDATDGENHHRRATLKFFSYRLVKVQPLFREAALFTLRSSLLESA